MNITAAINPCTTNMLAKNGSKPEVLNVCSIDSGSMFVLEKRLLKGAAIILITKYVPVNSSNFSFSPALVLFVIA